MLSIMGSIRAMARVAMGTRGGVWIWGRGNAAKGIGLVASRLHYCTEL